MADRAAECSVTGQAFTPALQPEAVGHSLLHQPTPPLPSSPPMPSIAHDAECPADDDGRLPRMLEAHEWAAFDAENGVSIPFTVNSFRPDCVCLVREGLGSLAAAAALCSTGESILFVCQSRTRGTVALAQRLSSQRADAPHLFVHPVGSDSGSDRPAALRAAVPYLPGAPLSTALTCARAAALAARMGVPVLWVLGDGVEMVTPSRVSGFPSHRPQGALGLCDLRVISSVLHRCGVRVELTAPYALSTTAEVVREALADWSGPEIAVAASACTKAEPHHRGCGICSRCLCDRMSLLAAGRADGAYRWDVAADPERYRGRPVFARLVGMLAFVITFARESPDEPLLMAPELLGIDGTGVSVEDGVATLRRYANELETVLWAHFPRLATMLG